MAQTELTSICEIDIIKITFRKQFFKSNFKNGEGEGEKNEKINCIIYGSNPFAIDGSLCQFHTRSSR